MKRILVVDDEQQIIDIIKSYFSDNGYHVLEANNSETAMLQLSERPDIILLDIMMPGLDGIGFCSQVRGKVMCPIIFLSAKTEETSKLLGLSAGGDDYITKPFSIKELYARVEAHLRRENRPRSSTSKVWFGPLWIDYNGKQCGIDDAMFDLAKKEFGIIEILSLNAGQVFSQDRIYERIWGYDAEGDAQTAVTEHIKRIRKKLSVFGAAEYIETVWGIGYRWKSK
jgi:DNA-binding response OmpR family regulator